MNIMYTFNIFFPEELDCGFFVDAFFRADNTCFCARRLSVSSSMARGDGVSTMVMSKQTPVVFLAAAP